MNKRDFLRDVMTAAIEKVALSQANTRCNNVKLTHEGRPAQLLNGQG